MTSDYYFITSRGVEFKQNNIVDGIGTEQYKQWKRIDKLFKVCDALTMADFAVYAYASCITPSDIRSAKRLSEIHYNIVKGMKHFGVDDFYMGTIYALNRNLNIQARGGQFIATRSDHPDDYKDEIFGSAQTATIAAAELYNLLIVENFQTFIP